MIPILELMLHIVLGLCILDIAIITMLHQKRICKNFNEDSKKKALKKMTINLIFLFTIFIIILTSIIFEILEYPVIIFGYVAIILSIIFLLFDLEIKIKPTPFLF
jgi:hypothetical protein